MGLKTLALLRWFVEAPRAHYLMKIDDDSFVHLSPMMPALLRENSTERLYVGHFYRNATPWREQKWAEVVWQQDYYPPYADGSGYILSRALAQDLSRFSYKNNM